MFLCDEMLECCGNGSSNFVCVIDELDFEWQIKCYLEFVLVKFCSYFIFLAPCDPLSLKKSLLMHDKVISTHLSKMDTIINEFASTNYIKYFLATTILIELQGKNCITSPIVSQL